MRSIQLLLLLLCAATTAHSAGGLELIPDSAIGRHARAWFEAYEKGDAAAIGAYAKAHLSQDAQAKTTLEARVQRMRHMKEEHGALTIVSVPEDDTAELSVVVKDAHGGFLELGFVGAPAPPHLLEAMRVELRDGPNAPPPVASGPPLAEAQLADAVRAEIARRPEFSGVVLLARGDRTLVSEARGVADRAAGTKIGLDTKFNLASIGKAFTKLAIAQLAQAGKLALSDPVTKYLPQFRVEHAQGITLAQLVDHRGGTGDVLDRAQDVKDRTTLTTVGGWMSLVLDQPLQFAPGTSQAYSNGGYVLLGGVIEKVSGEDYYAYLKRHVLDPAGMTGTSWPFAHGALANRAEGYTRRAAGGGHAPLTDAEKASAPVATREMLPERGSPAGGGYSTAPDLLKFMRAMRASRLASPAWTRWVVGGDAPGANASLAAMPADFGFGIAGGAPGANGVMEFEGAYDVIVLTNADPPNAEELTRAIRGLLRRVRPS
jgi:CubicO group peptidase (beta-lactamase class C family)